MVNLGPTEPATPYTPQPGDVGLVRMPGAVGKLIRFGQWLNGGGYHDYEHAFVYVGTNVRGSDLPGDGPKIIEAMPGGALLSPLSRYADLEPVYLRCPDEYRGAVASAALRAEGVPYSFADYLSIAAHRFRLPAPLLKRYVRSSKHMICSQLADHVAEEGGWHLFTDGRWEGDVTPADLYELYVAQQLVTR
jgi:hypothetical protein